MSQPIQTRFNELIAGVKGDVAFKIYGENLDQLAVTAAQIDRVITSVPGAADVRTEQTAGFPTFDVQVNHDAAAAAGITVEEVANTVAIAPGGRTSGVVLEGDRQTRIMVRAAETTRADVDAIGALPVMLPPGVEGSRTSVPLRTLVRFTFVEGLNQVSRENGKRRVVVQANVRGRDLGSFVAAAQQKVILTVPGLAFLWALWRKFGAPVAPDAIPLTLTGGGALLVNLSCAFTLARFRNHSGSLTKAAFLSARNDALANVAIITAGVVTLFTQSLWPDVVVGLGVAVMNIDAAKEVWEAAREEQRTAGAEVDGTR